MDAVGEDLLEALCACCGYQWAAPWAAATAPCETPCPGCGRDGGITLVAAPAGSTSGGTSPGASRGIDLPLLRALVFDVLVARSSHARPRAAAVQGAAAEAQARAAATCELAVRVRAEVARTRAAR